jgi:hypothetical protein
MDSLRYSIATPLEASFTQDQIDRQEEKRRWAQALSAAIRKQPLDPYKWMLRAEAHITLEMYAHAYADAVTVLDLAPDCVRATIVKSLAELKMGMKEACARTINTLAASELKILPACMRSSAAAIHLGMTPEVLDSLPTLPPFDHDTAPMEAYTGKHQDASMNPYVSFRTGLPVIHDVPSDNNEHVWQMSENGHYRDLSLPGGPRNPDELLPELQRRAVASKWPVEFRYTDKGFSIFAKKNIPKFDVIIGEELLYSAGFDKTRCYHCQRDTAHGVLPAAKCRNKKCNKVYCSNFCEEAAFLKYHPPFCGKDTSDLEISLLACKSTLSLTIDDHHVGHQSTGRIAIGGRPAGALLQCACITSRLVSIERTVQVD